MSGTIFSLIPPIVAIALALITKEVYLSLLIGIISGAMLFTGFMPLDSVEMVISIMGTKIGSNVNIVLFLSLLGIFVALITKSGASRAYGSWASHTIKSKRGALLATTLLGSVIFVDDYFNCLTVGTVMRPVTDRYRISRAKLAYVIDATAAPVCIIAPVSSWAAAVGSSLPEGSQIDGFNLFLRTIPYNFYALLTIAFMLYIVLMQIDFGAMKKYDDRVAERGEDTMDDSGDINIAGNGKVIDLLLPIAVLIILCISAMLYTGGILDGTGVAQAFADCNSSLSLVLGSFFALAFTIIFYLVRKVLSFSAVCETFSIGVKAMVPAVMILSLAWTLSGICSSEYLNIGGYVGSVMGESAMLAAMLPVIFFAVAMGLAFSTGTSWGTFGILIPIALTVLGEGDINKVAIAVAAILAGAVCGDHISPISDTTILASTGAGCQHINHVSTQIPYALSVAACSAVGYFVSGLIWNGWVGLAVSAVMLVILLGVVTFKHKRDTTESR